MKLLITTSLKEDQKEIVAIFDKAQIKVFSYTDIIGYKNDHSINLLDNWFASGDEKFDSIFLFSFTPDENALTALSLVTEYNQKTKPDYPIRAFIVPVEQSSY